MNEYIVTNKTFVKSNNKSSLIINRYFYSLLVFIALTICLYLAVGKSNLVLSLLKSLGLSFLIGSILCYSMNIIFKDNKFINIYKKDNIHTISLLIGLFAYDINIVILSIALFIAILIKKINKNINLSSSLYGILVILLYKYFNGSIPLNENYLNVEINKEMIIDYLIGSNSLNPILSILVFLYLFFKKSIKYNIFIAYLSTIFIIMLLVGIFNGMHIVLPLIVLASNSIIFLSAYALTDYMNTPTIGEMQIIYGIILGIITSILTFILSSFSVIIPLIIGPYILTKFLDNNSYKIKYRK